MEQNNRETQKKINKKVSLSEARRLIPNWKQLKLQAKYIKFIGEWLMNGHNATEAYMRHCASPGTSRDSASVDGARLLAKAEVRQAIKEILEESIGKVITDLEDKILGQLWRRAFYDPSMFVNDQGEPIFSALSEIPDEWRCCVESIETKYFGKDADVKTTMVRLADRDKAMDRLAKYIDMFREREPKKVDLGAESLLALSSMVKGFHNECIGKPPTAPGESTDPESAQ